MREFVKKRWSEITLMTGGQWSLVTIFSITIGVLLYAGIKAKSDESTAEPSLILPPDWEPYIDQAVDYLESDLEAWEGGQQGANLTSANIGFILDSQLIELYVRVYERLPASKRAEFRQEQSKWIKTRYKRASDAVESHGGTLAPLEFNMAFVRATKERIKELKSRLPKNKIY